MASEAALEAVTLCSKKQFTNRMKMTVMFPEMNPSMDSYRIGTLLELARSIAIKLAEQIYVYVSVYREAWVLEYSLNRGTYTYAKNRLAKQSRGRE